VLPPEQRAPLGLGPRERVAAAARLRDGTWAAATSDGLVLADLRLDWVAITSARWDHDSDTLALAWLNEAGTGSRVLLVDEPGTLPEAVRTRVTATIVLSRRVPVAGRAGVRIAARRQRGGPLLWQVVPDRGVDPDEAATKAAVDAALRAMAVELGD
jgi:hypothetical protein